MSLRIAVISDLHCHPKKGEASGNRTHFFSDGARARGNRHPIQYLLDLIDQEKPPLRATVLAIPGDTTDQANHHGFIVGVHCIREVAAKLGISVIAATIGNHDVDSRGIIGTNPFFAAKEMFIDFPIKSLEEQDSFFTRGFAIVEESNFRILLLNSVLSHTCKEAAEAGSATSVQIAALEQKLRNLPPKPFQVCVVHHHVIPHEDLALGAKDLLVGGEAILQLLEQENYSLVIHGHKHHPRLRYSTQGRLPVFAAGSLSAAIDPITGSACRNTFHIVELFETSEKIPYMHGRIDSWDLKLDHGWERTSRSSSSFPGGAGFGCHNDIDLLSSKINEVVVNVPFVPWVDLGSKIPQLQFLIPSDLERLAKTLESTYGLSIAGDRAEPIMVGRQTQPPP